ncbi:hypothetical protein BPTFM16_01716 [Altererythrobacter insulae]|nr:hypothetical protein BPTFM16_01716 [Altererythrobacter insulae]
MSSFHGVARHLRRVRGAAVAAPPALLRAQGQVAVSLNEVCNSLHRESPVCVRTSTVAEGWVRVVQQSNKSTSAISFLAGVSAAALMVLGCFSAALALS